MEDGARSRADPGGVDVRSEWTPRLCIEIVGYDNIQFAKAQNVVRGTGLEPLTKNEKAKRELEIKGVA